MKYDLYERDLNEDEYGPFELIDNVMSFANPIVTLITQPFRAINHYIGLN